MNNTLWRLLGSSPYSWSDFQIMVTFLFNPPAWTVMVRTTEHVTSSFCSPGAGGQVTECGRTGFPWWHSVQGTIRDLVWQLAVARGSDAVWRGKYHCHLRDCFHLVVLFRVHPASLHLPWGKAGPPVETQQGRTSKGVFLPEDGYRKVFF